MVATVSCLEYTQDPPGLIKATAGFIHILQDDDFSGTLRGFTRSPIRPRVDGAPAYSMERWIRFRFAQPFTQVFDFFFYMPDLEVPEGWSLNYGTAQAYQTPSASSSSIATGPVPTTKPERPNCGGVEPLDGDVERYSDWIVLQASVRDDAPVGPMLGFDAVTKQPLPLQYRFDWTEL